MTLLDEVIALKTRNKELSVIMKNLDAKIDYSIIENTKFLQAIKQQLQLENFGNAKQISAMRQIVVKEIESWMDYVELAQKEMRANSKKIREMRSQIKLSKLDV